MQRKALLGSLLTIGIVIALVGAVFSSAAWQDERTGTIDVTAGTVSIALNGDSTAATVPFTLDTTTCANDDNLGPDSSCDFDVTVSNAGSLGFDLTIGAIAYTGDVGGDTNPCFLAAWNPEPQTATSYAPTDSSAGTITVTVSSDDGCNGSSGGFTVLFTATYTAGSGV